MRKLRTLAPRPRLKGKRVLLRLDLNAPVELAGGSYRVVDDARVRDAVPTVVRLRSAGARLVVVTHVGEPNGRVVEALRVKPIVAHLRRLLPGGGSRVRSVSHWKFSLLARSAAALTDGDVLVLENVRFHPGEEANDRRFAQALAALADCYVNEAFSVSHRAHASVVAVPEFLSSYAGWRLAEEVTVLERVRTRPRLPFVLVLGGAKVHDKAAMMAHLAPRANVILLGGVVASTLLKFQGYDVGRSLVDDHPAAGTLRRLLTVKRRFPGLPGAVPLLTLPLDVLVAATPEGPARVVDFTAGQTVGADECIYDVGPKTVRHYAQFLRRARTVVWNGPLGFIEVRRFRHGSLMVAELVAARGRGRAFAVVGGGESVSVLNETGMAEHVDYVSTGGGAMLEYLTGQRLPGLQPLYR